MIEALLPLSVGIGLVVSLLFTELFGLAAGGMVVPGYIALYLTQPVTVVLTLLAGALTFGLVQAAASVTILYGRRRTALTILVGYIIGMGFRYVAEGVVGPTHDVIGYIIPGLIALWIARQGMVETFASLISVSVLVRLVMIIVVGEEMYR